MMIMMITIVCVCVISLGILDYLSMYQFVNLSICQFVNLSMYQFVNLSICQFVNLSIFCQFVNLSTREEGGPKMPKMAKNDQNGPK